MTEPRPAEEFVDLLLQSEEVMTAWRAAFRARTTNDDDITDDDAIGQLGESDEAEVRDPFIWRFLAWFEEWRLENLSIVLQQKAADCYDEVFSIDICRTGPLFWIRTEEFEDICYFLTEADADEYAAVAFASDIKLANLAETISSFFQSLDYGLMFPNVVDFRRELLSPIMSLGDESIREQHLVQLATQLREVYEQEVDDGDEDSAYPDVCALAEELCQHIPPELYCVVDKILSFRRLHHGEECSSVEPNHHALSDDEHSKRVAMSAVKKSFDLELQTHKEAIFESAGSSGFVSYLSTHPLAQTEGFAMLLPLMASVKGSASEVPIYIAGDGPWNSKSLLDLFRNCGVQTAPLSCDTSCAVVGCEGVDIDAMRSWLSSLHGECVVYPQELFVLLLLTGKDPLQEITDEHAKQWIAYHPVLRELFGSSYELASWPRITEGDDSFDDNQDIIQLLRGESPLAKMGYSVRQAAGFGAKGRRDLLRRCFEGKIPSVDPQKGIDVYMAQWGKPGTSQRLWRIARHLAGQINLKRPNPRQARAVQLWREDLDWLYQEIYPRIRFRFAWPRAFGGRATN